MTVAPHFTILTLGSGLWTLDAGLGGDRMNAESAQESPYLDQELERRVQERTAELTRANAALEDEITQRRRAEEQLRRVNRAHQALTICNQALVRATNERDFLQEICRIIVDIAGYRLCWVGYAEQDEARSIRPVAAAGYSLGYLETMRATWADTERGQGPAGTAIRTGRTCLFKDVAGDLRFAPWRQEALKRGYVSVLAIPLHADGQILGALTIHAAEPDACDDEEMGLLESLANDLAYGITALRTRIERAKAEEELRQAHDELEARVAERTVALAEANALQRQVVREHDKTEEELRTLMDTIPDSIYFKDRQSRFIRVNKTLARLAGVEDPCELLGKSDFDLFTDEHARQAYEDEQEILRTGQPLVGKEEKETWPDGRITWVSTTKMPFRDTQGQIIGTFGSSRDITERKRVEEELRAAKETAEAANQAKSAFLATMSHEIRTPMNAIIGMTELVLDTALSEEQREYLTLVEKSTDLLLTLLNDILDFSKIEAGKFELDHHPFGLRDNVADLLHTLALRAHHKGVELAYVVAADVPDDLVGDALRLRQVLVNLVGNAIKFTEQGEVVAHITVLTRREDDVALHFAVRDTGTGIPADQQERIFDPFSQGDNSLKRKYEGTGLGLAISARLVEMMGGRLRVESEVGKGSTFHFDAWFRVGQGPAEVLCPARPEKLRDLPVLVVDDNATNRAILAEILAHWGMKPAVAEHGLVALELLDRARGAGQPFAVILLDAHMPQMDGFRLAGLIRQRPQENGTVLLLLSSANAAGDADQCRALGIAGCLPKPIKQVDLYKAILTGLGTPVLPAEEEDGQAQTTVPRPSEPRRPLRILLAEDNPVNQQLAVTLLEKQGHAVTVACDGGQVLAALEREAFDVVLMDVQMPGMDGLEATRRIRDKEGSGPHIPIIAMTAYAMKGDCERCLSAGVTSYLTKPIHGADLIRALAAIVLAPPGPPRSPSDSPSIADCGLRIADSTTIRNLQSAIDGLSTLDCPREWPTELAGVEDDPELICELAAVFLDEYPKWLGDLHSALAEGDAARLDLTAHTLKGSLTIFAAKEAATAALRLEALARAGQLDGAGEALAALVEEVERLRPTLVAIARPVGNLAAVVGQAGTPDLPSIQ
jgi:two-component system sensor histidine kinase/response regulator